MVSYNTEFKLGKIKIDYQIMMILYMFFGLIIANISLLLTDEHIQVIKKLLIYTLLYFPFYIGLIASFSCIKNLK